MTQSPIGQRISTLKVFQNRIPLSSRRLYLQCIPSADAIYRASISSIYAAAFYSLLLRSPSLSIAFCLQRSRYFLNDATGEAVVDAIVQPRGACPAPFTDDEIDGDDGSAALTIAAASGRDRAVADASMSCLLPSISSGLSLLPAASSSAIGVDCDDGAASRPVPCG